MGGGGGTVQASQKPNGQFARKYCFFVKNDGLTAKIYNILCADNFNHENRLG